MKQIPILFLGDSPDLSSGLSRIGKDLACQLVGNPKFRIGYLGRGGIGSSRIPFQCYNFPERDQWGEQVLPFVWQEFSKGERGIIFTIWDPSRLHWLADPEGMPEAIRTFIQSDRFKKWGYFPIDSEGVGGRLSALSAATVRKFDRVLAYTQFGAKVLGKTLGREVDWIPHGFSPELFSPRDKKASRMAMHWGDEETVVGMVGTNQARKDWGLAFATAAGLRDTISDFRFWVHIDKPERVWSIAALAEDFKFNSNNLTVTTMMSDLELSYAYSACDCTMLTSLGEGFGYPLIESQACGVPVVHGNYAGGAEFVPPENLVEPACWRLETLHNCVRPCFKPEDWILKVHEVLERDRNPEETSERVSFLQWKNLWPVWSRFFDEGVA